MTNRNIGLEVLDGLNEIKEFKKGSVTLKAKTFDSHDTLPTKNVGSFVIELAKYHNVSYMYNSLDQFAGSVTRLAGDVVKHDHIEDLLVALKRAGKLSMQQVAQLSVNYRRERELRRIR